MSFFFFSTLQVIAYVNTAIPAAFIQQLLEPDSAVMKLRLSSDQAVSTICFTKINMNKEAFTSETFVQLCRSCHL